MTLEAENVSWLIDGVRIVDEVTMSAPTGTSIGLLGPNGSGKSSLLRMLAGLRRPSEGIVSVDGSDLGGLTRRAIAHRIALVEQGVSTDQDPLVRDVIELGRIPHRRAWAGTSPADGAAIESAAAATDVAHLLDRRYATLSGGERQRTQLARALAQEPRVLLLDEPTNHLDVRHQFELLQLVRSAAVTAVLALHDLNLAAAYCDRLVLLAAGRVVASGAPAEVLTPDLIAQVYGVSARVDAGDDGIHVRLSPHR